MNILTFSISAIFLALKRVYITGVIITIIIVVTLQCKIIIVVNSEIDVTCLPRNNFAMMMMMIVIRIRKHDWRNEGNKESR